MKKIVGTAALLLLVLSSASWYLYSSVHHAPTKAKTFAPTVKPSPSENIFPGSVSSPSTRPPPAAPIPPQDSNLPRTAEAHKGFQEKSRLYHSENTDASGLRIERIEVFDTSFRYPLVRTVSSIERDYTTGAERIVQQVSMVADHVMVKVKPGQTLEKLADRLRENGLRLRSTVVRDHVYLVQFDLNANDPYPGVIDRLKAATDWVEVVEPDLIVTTQDATPNDPAFSEGKLWNMNNTGQAGLADQDIDAPEGWAVSNDARDVVVAVIDTGIRLTHEDLKDNLWTNPVETGDGRENNGIDDDHDGYIDDVHGVNIAAQSGDPTDDFGHGTHVAGIIAASGNNGVGVVGVAWKAKIMAVKFLDVHGGGTLSDAISAMDYARAKGAQVINASWGAPGYSLLLEDAFRAAAEAGIAVVCAAGNNSMDTNLSPFTPAGFDFPSQISVAALDPKGDVSGFSNYGGAHLAAPGQDIYSTYFESDSSYKLFSGTSMAAPHVTGALALLRARYPSDTSAQLIQRLISGSMESAKLARPLRYNRLLKLPRGLAEANLPLVPLIKTAKPLISGNFGDTITIKNEVISSLPATYQWKLAGNAIPGATGTELTLTNIQREQAGSYVMTATNSAGTAASRGVFVVLVGPPTIIDFPVGTTVVTGNEVRLNATVLGNETQAIQYQWFHNEVALPQGVFSSLFLPHADASDSGTYRMSATNTYGTVMSPTFTLTVVPARIPVITTPPAALAVTANQNARFTVVANGTEFLTYQWYKDGVPLNNETSSTLSLERAQTSDAGNYSVLVSNSGGSIFSPTAQLTVSFAPIAPFILRQPVAAGVARGERLVLTIQAKGTPTPSYQWQRNGVDIPGATSATYEAEHVYTEAVGNYSVRVSNTSGSILSDVVKVTLSSGVDIPGWSWRSPLPQGNDLSASVFSKGRFVTVGKHGTVLTSENGSLWTKRSAGVPEDLWAIQDGAGKLVAMGSNGVIIVSDDGGLSWSRCTSGTTSELTSLTFGNGLFVGVSYDTGFAVTSTDGHNWTAGPPGALTHPGVMYANGAFYAVCYPGRILRSTDGVNWVLICEDPSISSICYGGGVFVAATSGLGPIMSSTDAVHWTPRSGPDAAAGFAWILYAGQNFIGVNIRGYLVQSPDGVTWSEPKILSQNELYHAITYGNGIYVASGSHGMISVSSDLSKWAKQTPADAPSFITTIAWGPAGFVAFDTNTLLRSEKGVLWNRSKFDPTNAGGRTVYLNDKYITLVHSGVSFSSDTQTWTQASIPVGMTTRGIAYGANKYVIVGGRFVFAPDVDKANIATSVDLKTWTNTPRDDLRMLYDVIWDGSRFVAVGEGGALLTSNDGDTWQQLKTLSDDLSRIAFDGKTYVAASFSKSILYSSPDLVTWSEFKPGLTRSLGGEGFVDLIKAAGRFVALRVDSAIFTSEDGLTWKSSDCGTSNQGVALCYGNGTLIAGGVGYLVQSGPMVASLNSIALTPARQLVAVGQHARIDLDTFGIGALQYQWFKDGTEIPGAIDSSLQLSTLKWSDAGTYVVRVRNGSSEGVSLPAYVATVDVSVDVTSQGGRGTIKVNAPDGFAWNIGGVADWMLFNRAPNGVGSGQITFTLAPNSGTGRSTSLVVGGQLIKISQPGERSGRDESDTRLINISSRGRLSGNGEPMIAGFIIQGSTPKRILLRAAGPALADFGLKDVLAHPRIQLVGSSGATIKENDNWNSSTDDVAGWTALTGAFPFKPSSHDAALVATLAPGAYTAMVSGLPGNSSGVALVEAYEVMSPEETLDGRRLINISTRAQVTGGEGVLIAGFIVSGTTARKYLIRGVGPELIHYGVTNVLGDPKIELHSGTSVLATNDNWETPSGAEVSAATTKSGAFPLPTGSRDAALVITLNPGGYTVVLSGAGSATGTALVEVYEISE